MIEPTESEDKSELVRFCDAMIAFYQEIQEVAGGKMDKTDNPLKQAPHTQQMACADEWNHAYGREKAAFPLAFIRVNKFWPSIGRINNTYGDRNLVCTCEPVSQYEEAG
jgi:glycine dehydrogenase